MSEERRRLIYENIDKIGERTLRRSFFEKSDLTTYEKEKTKALLDKWDQQWGKHNLDYVNVVKYPEEYVQKIKEEREMWLKGLDGMKKKTDIIFEVTDGEFMINEDILLPDQKASLSLIDSKINEYINKATTFLRDFEVFKRNQEIKLENIERERELIENIAVAKK